MINPPANRTTALERVENWISGISSPDGYHGPALGRKMRSMLFCGPGFDWRYAGLLDGYTAQYNRTGNPHYLNLITMDIRAICKAQLKNGTFKNSNFDINPIEGGVPHEQLMLAAAYRAQNSINEKRDPSSEVLKQTVELHIHDHLIKRLWNPTLGVFGNRSVSQFEQYDAITQAAAIELLSAYASQTQTLEIFEPYLLQAANAIANLQVNNGPDAGGIRTSNKPESQVNLHHSAQCLAALKTVAKWSREPPLIHAEEHLQQYIMQRIGRSEIQSLFERGGFIPGQVAALPHHLTRAGIDTRELHAQIISGLLPYQLESGAFPTRVSSNQNTVPHWSDTFPVCGWVDKIYRLLATAPSDLNTTEATSSTPRRVKIGLRTGLFIETDQEIKITGRNNRQILYRWIKTQGAPDVCKL